MALAGNAMLLVITITDEAQPADHPLLGEAQAAGATALLGCRAQILLETVGILTYNWITRRRYRWKPSWRIAVAREVTTMPMRLRSVPEQWLRDGPSVLGNGDVAGDNTISNCSPKPAGDLSRCSARSASGATPRCQCRAQTLTTIGIDHHRSLVMLPLRSPAEDHPLLGDISATDATARMFRQRGRIFPTDRRHFSIRQSCS